MTHIFEYPACCKIFMHIDRKSRAVRRNLLSSDRRVGAYIGVRRSFHFDRPADNLYLRSRKEVR